MNAKASPKPPLKNKLMQVNNLMNLQSILFVILFIAIGLQNAPCVLASPNAQFMIFAPQLSVNQAGDLIINITANETFNGTILLSYENITGDNFIEFADSDFSSNKLTLTHPILGTQPKGYQVIANLSYVDFLNQNQISQSKNEVKDLTAPRVIARSPTSATTRTITMSATTDENSTCKYSLLDQVYSLMEGTFSGEITHQITLTLSDGRYTYYVRCVDLYGNTMNVSDVLQFNISTDAYADITLNKETPLSAGIVEVTVLTSKNMNDVTLNYYYSDASTTINPIPLSGQNNLWKGYLIIPESSNTRVGTFVFSGTDTDGRTTTKINSGKLFVVDTTTPKTASDFLATSEAGEIKLKWYYSGDYGKFNIYRAESSGVSYVDLYEDTNETYYKDHNIVPKKTYYYRVAAVSDSGIVGPLSDEISVEAPTYYFDSQNKNNAINHDSAQNTQTNKQNENTPQSKSKTNSVETLKKITKKTDELTSLLLNLDKSAKDLANNDDPIEKNAIENLGIKADIDSQKDILTDIKKQLESYQTNYVEETDLDAQISLIDLKIKKAKSVVVKKLNVVDKSSFILQGGFEDVLSSSMYILNETEAKNNLNYNKKINDNLKVETNYNVVELTYLDDSSEKKTIIEKQVSYQSSESKKKVSIVETIPKTIAVSSDDISFKTKYIKILKKDPVISLDVDELTFDPIKIIYVVSGKKDVEEVKKTKTIVIGKEDNAKTNLFSGFAVVSTISQVGTYDWVIILGVLSIVFLGGYYFMFAREKPINFSREEMHGPLPRREEVYSNVSNFTEQSNIQNNQQMMFGPSFNGQMQKAPEMQAHHSKANHRINADAINQSSQKNQTLKTNSAKIKQLANQAHYQIDNMQYDSSKELYEQAVLEYAASAHILPMFEKSEIERTLMSVYNKLLLVSKISEANCLLVERDFLQAKLVVDEISRLNKFAVEKNRNTELASYSMQWNTYLRQQIGK